MNTQDFTQVISQFGLPSTVSTARSHADQLVEVRRACNRNLIFRHFTLQTVKNIKPRKMDDHRPVKLGPVGHVTIALQRPAKDSKSNEYKAAVSFGVPNDSENRKLARNIATGRLFSSREGRNFIFTVPTDKINNLDVIFQAALDKATDTCFFISNDGKQVPYAPLWVFKALESEQCFQVS